MTAAIIQFADPPGGKLILTISVADRKVPRQPAERFHDAFLIEQQAAFKLVKGRRICAMEHLAYQEFELLVADRIMKRKRMTDVPYPNAVRCEKSSWT